MNNTSTPIERMPEEMAFSSIYPESRVSLPSTILCRPRPRGWLSRVLKTWPAARPSLRAVSAVTGSVLAVPRTPSVPKIFLGELMGVMTLPVRRDGDLHLFRHHTHERNARRDRHLDRLAEATRGRHPCQIHHGADVRALQVLQRLGAALHGDDDIMGTDFDLAHVLSRGQDGDREVVEDVWNSRGFLLTGKGDNEPNHHGQRQREELEQEVLEKEMAQEPDHLPVSLGVGAAAESVFATAAGPGLTRSTVQERSQPSQFRERAGLSRTEVRKARRPSRVTPFTNWPL